MSSKVANAVGRNRVKRWVREAFRAIRSDLPPIDLVVVARRGATGMGLAGARRALLAAGCTRLEQVAHLSEAVRANTITVGSERDLYTDHATVTGIHWIGMKPRGGTSLQAKIRYRTQKVPVTLRGRTLRFARPVRAVAPGQSVVFYSGSRVLGGAFLAA